MKRAIIVVSCFTLVVATIAEGAKRALTYRCDIPDGLNPEIILHHKDGRLEKRNAHSIYKTHHMEGWKVMMAHYLKEGLSEMKQSWITEWGIMTDARKIGIAEARIALMKAELVMGREKVVALVKRTLPPKR